MPRNSSGTYTLPIGAFVPNGLIKSSDHNSNYSDIATALTQSLATTGVSTMSGALKAAAGSVGSPSITFGTDTDTGLFLAGTDQLGFSTNGTQVVTLNADQSVSWAGAATWGGNVTYNGAVTINGTLTVNGTSITFGAGAAAAFWQGIESNFAIEVSFNGGGVAIVGPTWVWVEVPCNCTLQRVTLLADQSGNAGAWIGTLPYSSFNGLLSWSPVGPSAFPTPAISFSGALKAQTTSFVGWSQTTFTAGSIIGIAVGGSSSVNSNATNCQILTVSLVMQRTGS
jgi:hypothetical protein